MQTKTKTLTQFKCTLTQWRWTQRPHSSTTTNNLQSFNKEVRSYVQHNVKKKTTKWRRLTPFVSSFCYKLWFKVSNHISTTNKNQPRWIGDLIPKIWAPTFGASNSISSQLCLRSFMQIHGCDVHGGLELKLVIMDNVSNFQQEARNPVKNLGKFMIFNSFNLKA